MNSSCRLRIRLSSHWVLCIVLTFFGLVSAPAIVRAQSGRKLPDWSKKKPVPAPTPEPDSTPTTQGQPSPKKPALPIVVTSYLPNINSSGIYTNVVVDGCLSRLGQSSFLAASRSGDMNRKEASDKAKSMTSGYVVWLELEADLVDQENSSIGPLDPSILYASFVIFNSGTGKIKTQGHVYQRQTYSRLPGPLGQAGYEYQLRQMGRETADRIMQAINVLTPPGH